VNGWPWRSITASVRGSSHDRSGLPNQDAVGDARAPNGALMAAVADGHGGRPYVRSQQGSALAVDLALEHLMAAGIQPGSAASNPLFSTAARVSWTWRATVLSDWAAHGFSPAERDRAGVDLEQDPVLAYGTTLILALCLDDVIHLAQIGDGDVIVISADGQVTTPVPGDDRLVAGETTSLCAASAVDDFRFCTLSRFAGPVGSEPAVLLLATDGYGAAFADRDWHEGVGRDLLAAVNEHGLETLATHLPQWLAESARVGGDDTSAVLITALPPAPPPR
jgi:serine/threonine protein phosphatase PrpC